MFNLLQKSVSATLNYNELFLKLIQVYRVNEIEEKRREYLSKTIDKFDYLPYPHYKAIQELTSGEILFCLIKILEKEGVYKDLKFYHTENSSVLFRKKIKNSNWIKKEGHNIKLISLSALGDGAKSEKCGTFSEWLAQIICLPKGNKSLNILPDTIYLLPFHPREFGCAYLPASSEVSEKMEDITVAKFLGLNAKEQVKLFIFLAQMAGHPVIYDILPQTGRFSKTILANPYTARWSDLKELKEKYADALNEIAQTILNSKKYNEETVQNTKNKYMKILDGASLSYTEEEFPIFEIIELYMKEIKIDLCNKMSKRENQEILAKRAAALIQKVNDKKIEFEEDIICREEIIRALTDEGLWTLSGGAWCSSGVPVFDRMSESGEYPICKHYNVKGEDVTEFANLDCQTPYYFAYLETGKLNEKVVDFYLKYTLSLQKEYNFDGYRVDHVDHIADALSEKDGRPISYRIPRKVLGKMSANLKKNIPYFALLAEYMLWDNYYSEYHIDMGFDILWGNDIVSQSSKTPQQIIKDNSELEKYNLSAGKNGNPLSILKTYNNQDGEFEAIDRYPGQLGENGALFKWFKFKFLPGGGFANRPSLYIDGDESFTKTGIECVIGNEVSLKRNEGWNFYEKFNAINYFAQNSKILSAGKAELISENENGLAAWAVNSPFGGLLIISNYKNPSEKMQLHNEKGESWVETVLGNPIYDIEVQFKGRKLKSYFEFEYDELQKCILTEKPLAKPISDRIGIGALNPAEFKIFGFDA